MRERLWIFSLAAGLTATAALAGLLLMASQLSAVSFAPLDISDALIRLTPGAIATQGIESLGPLAKQLIELTGILVFIGAGGFAGALYGRAAPRPWPAAGLTLALVALALTLAAQLLGGGLRGGAVGLELELSGRDPIARSPASPTCSLAATRRRRDRVLAAWPGRSREP